MRRGVVWTKRWPRGSRSSPIARPRPTARRMAPGPRSAGAEGMTWAFLFGFTNSLALAGWLMLAFLPRGPRLMSVILYGCVTILCLVYLVIFAGLLIKFVDPGSVAGEGG